MKNKTLKPYLYKHKKIGLSSWDNYTFILFRKSSDIVRKYNAWGISTRILLDLIESGCRIIIIKVNNVAKYKISPKEWLEKGIKDRLTPDQEFHSFLPIDKFERL